MRIAMFLCAALALMWVLPLPSKAQTAAPAGDTKPVTFLDLIGGKTLPLSLKLKELNGDWRRFTASGMSSTLESFITMAATEGRGMPGPTVFYTKGLTVTLNGETFLIAYQQEKAPVDLQQAMQGEIPPTPAVTADTSLNLALLNLRNAGNILDIRPFKLEDELAAGTEEQTILTKAREKALQSQSANNIRQCLIAVQIYAQDHEMTMPPMDNIDQVVAVMHLPEKVWKHPLTGEPYRANAKIGGKKTGELGEPQTVVIFYEGSNWTNGTRVVGFLDGHVELLREDRLNELLGQ